MGRALIYARHKFAPLVQAQIDTCRAWCRANGHEIVRQRRECGSMTALELAHVELETEELDFDLIVATTADRYDRNQLRLMTFVDQAAEKGAQLFTADGLELTGAAGKFMAQLSIAEACERNQEQDG